MDMRRRTILLAACLATVLWTVTAFQTARAETPAPALGFVSEVRLGALLHSNTVLSTNREDGIHINPEVLFESPDWMKWILQPHPALGLQANTKDTSFAYGGLVWIWDFFNPFFAEFSFGIGVHDGELKDNRGDTIDFGCRWLFREAIGLGVRFNRHHHVQFMWDHYSHGGICADANQGNDNLGLKYGYRF